MPNVNEILPEVVTDQPLSIQKGHPPPHHQSNSHYPEIPLTELSDTRCVICLENYEAGNTVGKLKECNHIFHENCLLGFLGVPSIYLGSTEPHQMYSYCLRKAVRACGSYVNEWIACLTGTCTLFLCDDIYSLNLHPRRIELSASDLALLHNPENPRFLADHLRSLRCYYHYGNDGNGNGEWFEQRCRYKIPACPCCRRPFEVRGSYTLYRITTDTATSQE